MNHQEFSWWLGGVLAGTPSDSPIESRAATLEVIRAQLARNLTTEKALARITEAQVLANLETTTLLAPAAHWTASEQRLNAR